MRRLIATLAALIFLGAAGLGGYLLAGGRPVDSPPPTIATGTAMVVRTDLVQTQTLAGNLRFAGPRPVISVVSGIVTVLPEQGVVIDRGGSIHEIDGQAAFLLLGRRPAWRVLHEGMTDGEDVRQLEENLAALGFGSELTIDDLFDDATADGVEAWREAAGMPEGRLLELGRVFFQPGAVRVGAHLVESGSPIAPGTPILEVSDPDQEVVVEIDPDDLDLVAEGDAVTVVLPDDRAVAGRITSVGRVVRPAGPEGELGVVEVLISLSVPVPDLDQSPVEVEVVSEEARGVLAVPVKALLALSDGGYAVEVRRGGETVLIGVETGKFAGGLVEVKGELTEGDQLVVPQ
jgi:peptidoglycan hydrolase-like protein with peptidoglycan-binding domain